MALEYKVVTAAFKVFHPTKSLEESVNKAITEGWEPLGGVAITPFAGGLVQYQALVRNK